MSQTEQGTTGKSEKSENRSKNWSTDGDTDTEDAEIRR